MNVRSIRAKSWPQGPQNA